MRLPTYEIANMSAPSQGARAMPLEMFSFAGGVTEYQGDTFQDQETGGIDFFQSVYIDNSQNKKPFTISFPGMGQNGFSVTAAPFTQGFYPVTIPAGIARYDVKSFGGVPVPVILYNIPMPYFVYNTQAAASAVSTGQSENHSGFIAAANVSQVAIPANPNRLRAVIQNPGVNNNSMWIQFGAAATENNISQEIAPGQEFDTANGPLDLREITIVGPDVNATYYASEIVAA